MIMRTDLAMMNATHRELRLGTRGYGTPLPLMALKAIAYMMGDFDFDWLLMGS